MADNIRHFLLVFDHNLGKLVELEEFGTDSDRAVAAYAAKEKELGSLGSASAIEIVLIGSDSLDTVKLTHANYFDGTAAVSKYLAGIG
ncbi:MAG: hypothetical protein ACREN2_06150 [Candidatus Dormibacteria bacterium]